MSSQKFQRALASRANDSRSLIERELPLEAISKAAAREKSIRQGHLSTLQFWWARRPLAVCRSTLFAALCPSSETVDRNPDLRAALDSIFPSGDTTEEQLLDLTGRLATWSAAADESLLGAARTLLTAGREVPVVLDSFAGGGSIPLEALRLGLDARAGELNAVAVVALRAALERLPAVGRDVLGLYSEVAASLEKDIARTTARLYAPPAQEGTPLAFFWCRTYSCPSCGIEVPLLKDKWLAKGKRNTAVTLAVRGGKKTPEIVIAIAAPQSAAERRAASLGTVDGSGATCPACGLRVSTSTLRQVAVRGELGERMYAVLELVAGERVYRVSTRGDASLAEDAALSDRPGRRLHSVPDQSFDPNGVRHTWAMQYGVTSTAALYSRRQGVALLEVFHCIDEALNKLESRTQSAEQRTAHELVRILLALTFNRLIIYGTRHAWWQSNGEFPANMFGRQAIPMVWNYVEIPVSSVGASGWKSARSWVRKVAEHCASIPRKGQVWRGDAAHVPLDAQSVDLVAIDPPYYDSITYGYLADTFYVWMRELVGDLFPADFAAPVADKAEEAIVDRKHSQAPAPKSGVHFRRKMTQAFCEAKRVLRPGGTLLLMYGHKRPEAWDALMGALSEAGFVPTASWPLQMERKVKFRHGHIDALSSSCLLVCRVQDGHAKRLPLEWTDFEPMLSSHLALAIRRFESAHVLGTDLITSLIAPSVEFFSRFEVSLDGSPLSVGRLIELLPELTRRAEQEVISADQALSEEPHLARLARSLTAPMGQPTTWLDLAREHRLVDAVAQHARYLIVGNTTDADVLWDRLSMHERQAACSFLRMAAISSTEESRERQLAQASLSRIALRMRAEPIVRSA